MPQPGSPFLVTDVSGNVRRPSEFKFAEGTKTVSSIVSTVSVVTRAVPGVPGKVIGIALAGLEKDVGTGRVGPGVGTLSNFLPSPFGFMRTDAYGLERNYYLSQGSTQYVPEFLDFLGIGLPEQRALDAEGRRQALQQRAAAVQRLFVGQSDDVVMQMANGDFSSQEAQRLVQSSQVGTIELRGAARGETILREADRRAGARGNDPLKDGVVIDLTVHPSLIRPTNEAARRNQRRRTGIDKELANEVADP